MAPIRATMGLKYTLACAPTTEAKGKERKIMYSYSNLSSHLCFCWKGLPQIKDIYARVRMYRIFVEQESWNVTSFNIFRSIRRRTGV